MSDLKETLHQTGYRIYLTHTEDGCRHQLELVCRLYVGGESVARAVVWTGSAGVDDADAWVRLKARGRRLRALMREVAWFLTVSGEDRDDMFSTIQSILLMPKLSLVGLRHLYRRRECLAEADIWADDKDRRWFVRPGKSTSELIRPIENPARRPAPSGGEIVPYDG